MRREEDQGLESREDMVELREREIDEDQAALDEEREALEERRDELDEQITDVSEPAEDGEEPVAQPGQEERLEELQEDRAQVEEDLARVEDEQQELDQRTEEVLEMRDDIAEDRQAQLDEQPAAGVFQDAPAARPAWFVMVDNEGDGVPFGRVVLMDLTTGTRVVTSSVTSVRGRTLIVSPDSILVIAGMAQGNARVRAVLLDPDTLEVTAEGEHEIFEGSQLLSKDNRVYMITRDQGEWYLGRFGSDLSRQALSDRPVEPWTAVLFFGDDLFVQAADGTILRLDADTLQADQEIR